MLLDYFHLREQPFGVTPDPRYLYLSRTHREALASLYYGIDMGRGFMALISEAGMGKTTLLFRLLERLRKSSTVAFLFQTQCDSRELLRYLLADLGLETHGQDIVELHAQLNQALIGMSRAGRRFVLVIDEAQNLDTHALETVRLLSDFETPSSKLMQIILSGQPQLAEKLASPPLVQLRQRIAILSRLEPFGPQETAEYIKHRLRLAGYEKGRLFTSSAEGLIADRSEGIPRNINNLCFNALSLGCALRRSQIGREIVLEAAKDLEVQPLGQPRPAAGAFIPPPPVTERSTISNSVPQRGSGHRLIWSAAFGAILSLTCLLMFPATRQDYTIWFTKAWTMALEAGKHIQLDFTTHSHTTSPRLSVSNIAPAKRKSVVAARDKGIPNIVEVKSGNTFSEICIQHFGRVNRGLVQRIRALNPQITDLNHIEVGQRILLPRQKPMSTRTISVGLGRLNR